MSDVLMQRFIQLVASHTGLHIRKQDQEDLYKKICTRMKLLGIPAMEKYYQLLEAETNQNSSLLGTCSKSEWRELTLLLTTGETYFFRDQGQINVLKNRILPELIDFKKNVYCVRGEAKPSLRIWSAGCSTGEEPYSLAILIKELIPDWNRWNILILGTDINQESIEKAKRGIYSSWSFRTVKPLQMRYFQEQQNNWEVNREIRALVKFQFVNLLKDQFPSVALNIHSMDLIVCRNVFIYFKFQTVSKVLEKFSHTLRPGGYLVAGHSELQGQNLGQLQMKVFPESVVYQRGEENPSAARNKIPKVQPLSAGISLKTTVIPKTLHSDTSRNQHNTRKANLSETQHEAALMQAEALFRKGAYASAIREAEHIVKQYPKHFRAHCLMAQALANLGNYEQATHSCQQALEINSLSVAPYYVLAHIADEQGDVKKAKDLLKKIIYLVPTSIPAYLELGTVFEIEGDITRAKKMRQTAFDLLKKLPPHTFIETPYEMTAGELLLQVKKSLN